MTSMWSTTAGEWALTSAEADPDPDERCISCGAEMDHYLGCPDDPDPDYEAEAAALTTESGPTP